MATTTNYGWTTPDNTDLVKDGAAAIRTLGSAIDTSMNTALGTKKAGLVLLNTTSFSGVTSFSLAANTFSATYLNYRILIQLDSTANSAEFDIRARASGTDNTSSNYVSVRYGNGPTNTFQGSTSGTSLTTFFRSVPVSGTYPSFQVFDILSPFSTDFNLGYLSQGFYLDAVASNWVVANSGGSLSVNTSYDSLTFFTTSATNMTGKYSVYGYNA